MRADAGGWGLALDREWRLLLMKEAAGSVAESIGGNTGAEMRCCQVRGVADGAVARQLRVQWLEGM